MSINIKIGKAEYEGIADTALKLRCIMESTNESGTVGNTAWAAYGGYNPFFKMQSDEMYDIDEKLKMEADDKEDWKTNFQNRLSKSDNSMSQKHKENDKNSDENEDNDDETREDMIKSNAIPPGIKNHMNAAAANINRYVSKAQGFANSSVAKVNEMSIDARNNKINNMIADARGEPKTISEWVKKGVTSAGKAIGLAGLYTVSLPLAVGALVVGKKLHKKDKKIAANKIKSDLILIDAELKKAENSGDVDRQADLLILKRSTQQAYNKLRWGIETDPRNNLD